MDRFFTSVEAYLNLKINNIGAFDSIHISRKFYQEISKILAINYKFDSFYFQNKSLKLFYVGIIINCLCNKKKKNYII